MRRSLSLLSVLLLCLLCSGCVQVATLIELNLDGSGKVLIRYLVSKEASKMSKMFAKNKDPEFPKKMKEFEEAIPSVTPKMGEGVSFVGSQRFDQAGWVGVVAEFKFEDANKLVLPADLAEKAGKKKGEGKDEQSGDILYDSVRFSFTDGDIKTLSVFLEGKEKDDVVIENDPFAEAGLELRKAPATSVFFKPEGFKDALRGARFTTLVTVKGEVVESDAVVMATDNSAVIFDANFSEIVGDPSFESVIMGQLSLEQILKKGVSGFVAKPISEPVTIKFRAAKE